METFHPLFGDTNYKESLSGRGLTLSWNNLSIYGKRRDPTCNNFWRPKIQRFKLLHKVSGIAESGSLLAIMGPSGAGKTTLLACISQRIQGDVDGQILLNGLEVEKNLMVKVSGFVPQHDLTVDTLTVHEHMTLMARLKMDRNLHHVERARTVDALLKELGLLKCKNSVLNVLSGGERKRVALAVQVSQDCSRVVKITDSQPRGSGFESRPGRKFSNQTFPFLDRHGCKRMRLEVMRKRNRGTIIKKGESGTLEQINFVT
ncbi:protein brown isoform X2 [Diaphorina citri]|uniref:Protein brown isoform X2 n=1 Tax=Diaphorina citri TaxID=121845 RepID=A0A3Q0J7W2_DIACI|nr:protein brown isoform X2 [Diaphorina citri]